MSDNPTERILAAIHDLRDDLFKMSAEVIGRIDRVQDTITSMRNDVAVNFGAADAVRRAHDGTREELRSLSETMSVMVRQIRALSERVEHLESKQ